jgi:hypothetical protein
MRPIHSGTSVKRGNLVVLLASYAKEVGERFSQEEPTEQRGWDQGESKGRSVIERIEGESPTDDRPSRESGLTSLWS